MSASRNIFVTLAIVLAGCGGNDRTNLTRVFDIDPKGSTVVLGGTVEFLAVIAEYRVRSIAWSVRDGVAGGAVEAVPETAVQRAIYTAPSQAGTYHVDALLTDGDGGTHQADAAITVTPQGG